MKYSFYRLEKEVGWATLKKFNYSCVECGSKEKLCVHHTDRSLKPSDKKYHHINNLIVLCRPCHMSYHRKAGHIVGNIWGRRGKGNLPVNCKIKGCNKLQHAKGLCHTHYEHRRRQLKK